MRWRRSFISSRASRQRSLQRSSWLSIFWFASAACSRATRSPAAISGRRIAGSRRNISPPLPRFHREDEPVREGEERRKRAALAHQHLEQRLTGHAPQRQRFALGRHKKSHTEGNGDKTAHGNLPSGGRLVLALY